MYKNEILTKVLNKHLGLVMDKLEKNYQMHSEKVLQSFKLLDEVEKVGKSMQDIFLNKSISGAKSNASLPKRDINKSFTSTTQSKTLIRTKSKVSIKNTERPKTPLKQQDKSKDRKNVSLLKGNEMSKSFIKNSESSKIVTKRFERSKTPRNIKDLSPLSTLSKKPSTSKLNTPINNKQKLSLNLKPTDKVVQLARNLKKESERKVNFNATVKVKNEFAFDNKYITTNTNTNISQIIDADHSMPDDSLINNKEDLLIMRDDDFNFNNSILTNNFSPCVEDKHELKLDYDDVLDDRWALFDKFMNKEDKIKVLFMNKKHGRNSVNSFIDKLKLLKENIEDKIERLKVLPESSSPSEKFVPSKPSQKAIDILNESLHVKIFNEKDKVPKKDILLVYMLYFQLINNHITRYFNDNKVFWRECCKYFIENTQDFKTGCLIQEEFHKLDSSPENIYKLLLTLGDNINKMNPNNFSKNCGTTGLFVFFVKDALDYLGIGNKQDKNTNILKLISTLTRVIELIMQKLMKLNSILNKYYNIY